MMRKPIFGVLAVVALAIALAPASWASCSPGTQFGDAAGGSACPYSFVIFDGTSAADNTSIIGRFWQPGNRSSHNEGTYDDSNWLYAYPPAGPTAWAFSGTTGAAGVVGCPVGEMIMLIQTTSSGGAGAQFTVGRVLETPANPIAFDYSCTGGNWSIQTIPRPRVTSSSRSGTNVILNVSFDNVSAAYHEDSGNAADANSTVNAYRLLTFTGTSDPGRSAGAWTLHSSAANAGGATLASVSVDCTNTATDVFLATQLSFDGGQFLSDYVSASTRVECDPNLAEPGKFKLIDKKQPKGIGTKNP